MRTRRYKRKLIGFPRRRYYSCPGIVGISQRLHKGMHPKTGCKPKMDSGIYQINFRKTIKREQLLN